MRPRPRARAVGNVLTPTHRTAYASNHQIRHYAQAHSQTQTPRIYTDAALRRAFAHAEFTSATSVVGNGFPEIGNLPEVVVTGRANAGKSSLFNAVLGRTDLLHTSSKPGRTRQLNFFTVCPNSASALVLVDAPGYGKRGKTGWGALFDSYVRQRKELRRVYVCLNGKHHLNAFDEGMLTFLEKLQRERDPESDSDSGTSWDVQPIITKGDELPVRSPKYNNSKTVPPAPVVTKPLYTIDPSLIEPLWGDGGDPRRNSKTPQPPPKPAELSHLDTLRQQIYDLAPSCLPPIVTSARMVPPFGIRELREGILSACHGPID